jgi:predicted nucleotide-binding protein
VYGRLGRDRVCILFKRGTQIHSDLEGIERVEFNESVEEVVSAIERELKAASLLREE